MVKNQGGLIHVTGVVDDVNFTDNQIELAKKLYQDINKNAWKTKFYRAGNEPTFNIGNFKYIDKKGNEIKFIEEIRDPYEGLRGANKDTIFEVKTDGVYEDNVKTIGLITESMVFYRVSNYNYIVILQHFKNKSKDSTYQSIFCKDVNVKILLENILKGNLSFEE